MCVCAYVETESQEAIVLLAFPFFVHAHSLYEFAIRHLSFSYMYLYVRRERERERERKKDIYLQGNCNGIIKIVLERTTKKRTKIAAYFTHYAKMMQYLS